MLFGNIFEHVKPPKQEVIVRGIVSQMMGKCYDKLTNVALG